MKGVVPYWLPEADFSDTDFFIRRMDTSGHVRAAQVPTGSVPLTGFLYMTGGEALVEAEGDSYLCYPGQLLLIPENMSFAIRYYQDAKGYSGAFSTTIFPTPGWEPGYPRSSTMPSGSTRPPSSGSFSTCLPGPLRMEGRRGSGRGLTCCLPWRSRRNPTGRISP